MGGDGGGVRCMSLVSLSLSSPSTKPLAEEFDAVGSVVVLPHSWLNPAIIFHILVKEFSMVSNRWSVFSLPFFILSILSLILSLTSSIDFSRLSSHRSIV